MAKASLTKRLTKELTRNPKKTAVLGLLALVAIWFWAPLATRFLSSGSGADAVSEMAAASPVPPTATASALANGSTAATAAPELNWQQLVQLLASEKLMASADPPKTAKDPFARPALPEIAEAAAEASADKPPELPPTTPSPEQLGLTLTSTITGVNVRLAAINGKLCEVGALLAVPAGNIEHEFTIIDITPEAVKMKGTSQEYTLERKLRPSSVQLSRTDARPAISADGSDHRRRIVIHAFGGE